MQEMLFNMKKQIEVSIILPTYNRAYIIENAIRSVLEQTFQEWELIIVDDGSSDDTEKVLEPFLCDRIFYIQNEVNRGANYSRNLGIANARGQYIAFLDSDNIWKNTKLEKQFAMLKKSSNNVGFVFHPQEIHENHQMFVFPDKDTDIENLNEIMFEYNIIDTNTALVKKECLRDAGGFDVKMPRLQDWEMFFRILNVFHYRALYDEECLSINYLQTDSISIDTQRYINAKIYFLKKYWDILEQEYVDHHFRDILNNCNLPLDVNNLRDNFLRQCSVRHPMIKYFEEFLEKNTLAQNAIKNSMILDEWIKRVALSDRRIRLLEKELLWKVKYTDSIIGKELSRRGYHKIALYGLGKWGNMLYYELLNSDVEIVLAIDKNVTEFHGMEVKHPEGKSDIELDMILVSIYEYFDEVKGQLRKQYNVPILSLEEIINVIGDEKYEN